MLFLINIYLFMTYLLLYVICIWRNMQILINIKSNFCLQIIAEIFQYYKVFLFNIIQRNLLKYMDNCKSCLCQNWELIKIVLTDSRFLHKIENWFVGRFGEKVGIFWSMLNLCHMHYKIPLQNQHFKLKNIFFFQNSSISYC